MTSRLKYPPSLAQSDDLGLSQIKRQIERKQSALAEMFMRAILSFIDNIELTPISPEDMAGALEVFNAPDLAYSYLIWRSPTCGTVHVMAYRFSTSFVNNDTTHSVTYESAFESGAISDDKWPEALREHIEKGRIA